MAIDLYRCVYVCVSGGAYDVFREEASMLRTKILLSDNASGGITETKQRP